MSSSSPILLGNLLVLGFIDLHSGAASTDPNQSNEFTVAVLVESNIRLWVRRLRTGRRIFKEDRVRATRVLEQEHLSTRVALADASTGRHLCVARIERERCVKDYTRRQLRGYRYCENNRQQAGDRHKFCKSPHLASLSFMG